MIRDHLNRALVISAGVLLAAAAAAQAPQAAAPAKANAAPQAQDAPGKQKPEDKGKTTDVKADPSKDGKDSDATKAVDHAAKVKAQHDAERAKLSSLVHGAMSDAMKQELQRHARRMARLERIKSLATDAKDKDAVDRSSKLIDKETTRHDKWLTTFAATAQVNPNPDTKGGAR